MNPLLGGKLASLIIVWWLCSRIAFIDASTEEYEEAGDYEEEEEQFDICANQGKLI